MYEIKIVSETWRWLKKFTWNRWLRCTNICCIQFRWKHSHSRNQNRSGLNCRIRRLCRLSRNYSNKKHHENYLKAETEMHYAINTKKNVFSLKLPISSFIIRKNATLHVLNEADTEHALSDRYLYLNFPTSHYMFASLLSIFFLWWTNEWLSNRFIDNSC